MAVDDGVSDEGAALTVSVTGTATVCGLEPVVATVIVPVYVPTGREVGLANSFEDNGTDPLSGEAVSQGPPEATTVMAAPAGPLTATVCAAGSLASPS